ncbi:MAG: ABC transporter ATP-binding protein [Chloroflexi bacterium HGW-Chloroflexi-3]|nr:MAG: ABC transporter ATP-binding protein [Chloroflexi bacterium HGW-Chloroflexi-3]
MSQENGQPVVEMKNIVKRFGTVEALRGVDFTVEKGKVHALIGDNGAGKSTLIKVLTGVHTPTSGAIYFEGKQVTISSPADARALGIETCYQDLALIPLMSIWRNFFLGREIYTNLGPVKWLHRLEMCRLCSDALHDIGIEIRSAREKVGKMSGGERQSIAIGRAIHFGAKLLILDEPTSALSVAETRKVLSYIENAKAQGLPVILITHNVSHIYQVSDYYTIIRHGRKVGTYRKGELTQEDIADLITGTREA